jgi:hypothetical protein|tara:strand:+ start:112 stop:645 length:534 start_codon:yes stop_codon:yes gene_type:complete
MINCLHKYLHEYDFPYSDYLKQYESYILKCSSENSTNSNDVYLHEQELNSYIIPKIIQIINDNYIVSSPLTYPVLRGFVLNDIDNSKDEYFHNHSHLLGNINVVFYINLPQEGGGLSFKDENENIFEIKPKENKIYLMPHWLYHRPLPQKDNINRISFNWNYTGSNRPINKFTGDIW